MTNGEKIRSMTNEELAEFFDRILSDCVLCPVNDFCNEKAFVNCEKTWKLWLKSEAKND